MRLHIFLKLSQPRLSIVYASFIRLICSCQALQNLSSISDCCNVCGICITSAHPLARLRREANRTSRQDNGKNFACANGGSRYRVCARLTLRSAPHRHQRKCFGARVWEGGKKMEKFQAILSTFYFFKKKQKKSGVPQICFHPKSYFF